MAIIPAHENLIKFEELYEKLIEHETFLKCSYLQSLVPITSTLSHKPTLNRTHNKNHNRRNNKLSGNNACGIINLAFTYNGCPSSKASPFVYQFYNKLGHTIIFAI